MDTILLVDDEPNLLNAFKRKLSSQYQFILASSAAEGLEKLATTKDISVIVSDMHMPGMQGTEFLKEASKKSPLSVRMMLTGLADQKTAVRAINDGSIFRFLNKPCSTDDFERAIQDGIVQHKLLAQEKDMLQNTLGGVIRLISDLLSFIDPHEADLSMRTKRLVRELAGLLGHPALEMELAAMLSGIGRLSLPFELLTKVVLQQTLTDAEQSLCKNSFSTSAKLLSQIPRLEKVSAIIACLGAGTLPADSILKRQVVTIQIARKLALNGNEHALEGLQELQHALTPDELSEVRTLLQRSSAPVIAAEVTSYTVSLKELCPGQRLVDDIKDKSGKLLLRKGFFISEAVIERLKNHDAYVGIVQPLSVNARIPPRNGHD